MSFVDLMGSVVWSEADIVRRTEEMVRSSFSAEEEAILNRKTLGSVLGMYQMTPGEQAEMAAFAAVTEQARQAGVEARADMALLSAVLELEDAVRVLQREDATDEERVAAQAVVDAATPEVNALYEQRSGITYGAPEASSST